MHLNRLTGGELKGEDFTVVEWTDLGITGFDWITPRHVHHADDEAWYVLEGTLRFEIGAETFEAGPGAGVLAPRGTPHRYGNARPGEPARYLLVMPPRIRALVNTLHTRGLESAAEVFARHQSELLES